MCTSSVSNVIYHKFSHGAAFYTLNGKNVNVMLEFEILPYRQFATIAYGLGWPSCIDKMVYFGSLMNVNF